MQKQHTLLLLLLLFLLTSAVAAERFRLLCLLPEDSPYQFDRRLVVPSSHLVMDSLARLGLGDHFSLNISFENSTCSNKAALPAMEYYYSGQVDGFLGLACPESCSQIVQYSGLSNEKRSTAFIIAMDLDLDLDHYFPFSDLSKTLQRINMYPYFDISHYILMCSLVREDTPQLGAPTFSRNHPFASWLASMLMCFAGTIIGNGLTGDPLVVPFQNHRNILVASIVWYIINYAPFDIVYKMVKFAPVHLVVCLLKEIQRTRKVFDGVAAGVQLYPHAYLLNVFIGLVKGSGSAEMKLFERLIRGVWLPAVSEMLRPSATTKACLVVAIAFLMEHTGHLPPQYHNHVYLGAAAFFVLLRLVTKLMGPVDPFAPLESLTCVLLFGGLADAISGLFRRGSGRSATSSTAPAVATDGGAGAATNGATQKAAADKKKE